MEPDIFDLNYEEDLSGVALYWEAADGFWYVPYPLEGGENIPEVVLKNHEALSIMPISTETEEQNVQTDDWTQDKSVNTDDTWEQLMRILVEQSSSLAEECVSLEKQQAEEEREHKRHKESLEKFRDAKLLQHRALLDKIESVQVKLNLNSSKTTRKNFTAKVEELTAERDHKLEAKKKLVQELEELDGRLKTFTEEQRNESTTWEKEIAGLQQEMERLSRQVEESNQAALKDEMAALESQRDLAVSQVEDWLAEAERYLSTLRSDTSPQNRWQRLEWEKNLATIRNSLGKLQASYNESLKQLLQGKQLDSLPQLPLPPLPHIPTIDLLYFTPFAPIRPPVTQPQFHPAHRHTPPPLAAQNPPAFMPYALEQNTAVPRLVVPTSVRAHSVPHSHPQYTVPYAPVPAAQGSLAPRAGLVASVRNPAAQALPLNTQPAGKLDKLLEILGTQFPHCTRAQIMSVLQQVKSERGTMAGMSIEDIKQQVEQKLAPNVRPPPGPMAPPAGSRNSHRAPVQPSPSLARPPVPGPCHYAFPFRGPQAAPFARKRCLMCQNHVEPGTQYDTSCPHTLHKECISVWLQTNNNCPYCPSK